MRYHELTSITIARNGTEMIARESESNVPDDHQGDASPASYASCRSEEPGRTFDCRFLRRHARGRRRRDGGRTNGDEIGEHSPRGARRTCRLGASGKPQRLHRRTTGPRISPAGNCFECTLKYQRPSLRSLAWSSSILTTPWKGLARLPGVPTWIGAFSSGVRPR